MLIFDWTYNSHCLQAFQEELAWEVRKARHRNVKCADLESNSHFLLKNERVYTNKNFCLTHFNKDSGRAMSLDSRAAMIPWFSHRWAKNVVSNLAPTHYAACVCAVLAQSVRQLVNLNFSGNGGERSNTHAQRAFLGTRILIGLFKGSKPRDLRKEECGFDRQEEFALTSCILKVNKR